MRKALSLAIFATLFAFNSIAQHQDKEIFSASISAGISPTEYGGLMPTIGCAFTFHGIYADVSCKHTQHAFDKAEMTWDNETQVSNFHIGYRFSFDNIGIAPILGISIAEKGCVTGGNLTLDFAGIHNKFTPKDGSKHFDYGIVLDACLPSKGDVGTKVSCKFARHDIEIAVGITI